MISERTIDALTTKYQSSEGNVRREYFQHLFLSYFYQQPKTDIIYFKGGTALRVIYQSPRFSEDLDFSTSLRDTRIIEQVILQTLEAIEKEGIDTNLQEAKKTSGGYLAIINFQALDKSSSVQLEISLRKEIKRGDVVTIVSDFIPSYIVIRLPQEQLVSEKIQALLTRKKPRDFYDLYFILRSNLLPVQKRNILPKTLKTLQQTTINFENELKQFLPKSHWPIIKDFKKTLLQEIERYT